MAQRTTRYAVVVTITAIAVAGTVASVLAVTRVGTGAPTAATGKPACSSALIRDWSDGRIDRDYSVGCYRTALRTLPADLRVYSSAPDDIRQALSARIVQGRSPQKISGHQGATSVRKLESARSIAP